MGDCQTENAATFKNWREQILDYFIERITNGFVEGLNNGLRTMIRTACGFRNFSNFRLEPSHNSLSFTLIRKSKKQQERQNFRLEFHGALPWKRRVLMTFTKAFAFPGMFQSLFCAKKDRRSCSPIPCRVRNRLSPLIQTGCAIHSRENPRYRFCGIVSIRSVHSRDPNCRVRTTEHSFEHPPE